MKLRGYIVIIIALSICGSVTPQLYRRAQGQNKFLAHIRQIQQPQEPARQTEPEQRRRQSLLSTSDTMRQQAERQGRQQEAEQDRGRAVQRQQPQNGQQGQQPQGEERGTTLPLATDSVQSPDERAATSQPGTQRPQQVQSQTQQPRSEPGQNGQRDRQLQSGSGQSVQSGQQSRPTPPQGQGTADGERSYVDNMGGRFFPVKVGDSTVYAFTGNQVFHHNGAVITCDSTVRHTPQIYEWFGNVIINKDSTFIYGDRVFYNGNTNTAEVFSPLIKLIDGRAVLYTYNLLYNTKTNVGEYYGGGSVRQDSTLLESERGYYYGETKDVVAVGMAELKDSTYMIRSDSLGYNMNTEKATFYAKTYIWNEKGEILSADRGVYHTREKRYNFYSDAYILSEEKELWADDIDYLEETEDAILKRNIQIRDEEQKVLAFGDYGLYFGLREEAMLTENPSVVSFDHERGDSLFMRADSMFLFVVDSLSKYHPGYQARMDSIAKAEAAAKAEAEGGGKTGTADTGDGSDKTAVSGNEISDGGENEQGGTVAKKGLKLRDSLMMAVLPDGLRDSLLKAGIDSLPKDLRDSLIKSGLQPGLRDSIVVAGLPQEVRDSLLGESLQNNTRDSLLGEVLQNNLRDSLLTATTDSLPGERRDSTVMTDTDGPETDNAETGSLPEELRDSLSTTDTGNITKESRDSLLIAEIGRLPEKLRDSILSAGIDKFPETVKDSLLNAGLQADMRDSILVAGIGRLAKEQRDSLLRSGIGGLSDSIKVSISIAGMPQELRDSLLTAGIGNLSKEVRDSLLTSGIEKTNDLLSDSLSGMETGDLNEEPNDSASETEPDSIHEEATDSLQTSDTGTFNDEPADSTLGTGSDSFDGESRDSLPGVETGNLNQELRDSVQEGRTDSLREEVNGSVSGSDIINLPEELRDSILAAGIGSLPEERRYSLLIAGIEVMDKKSGSGSISTPSISTSATSSAGEIGSAPATDEAAIVNETGGSAVSEGVAAAKGSGDSTTAIQPTTAPEGSSGSTETTTPAGKQPNPTTAKPAGEPSGNSEGTTSSGTIQPTGESPDSTGTGMTAELPDSTGSGAMPEIDPDRPMGDMEPEFEQVVTNAFNDFKKDLMERVAMRDSLAKAAGVVQPDPNAIQRVMVAYNNVKIFRSDFQAVCDSMVAFTIDSTIRMYVRPLMWNGDNQIASHEAVIYTKNQEIERAFYTGGEEEGNPIMSARLDYKHFNQVTGKTLEAFFYEGDIYRMDAVGNCFTYYYLQEDDTGALQGFLTVESADASFYIADQTLDRITYRVNPVYAIYPMTTIPASQPQVLPNFKWEGDLKPSQDEIFDRTIRDSQREEYLAMPTPTFRQTREIDIYRRRLVAAKKWKDRTEDISEEAHYFIEMIRANEVKTQRPVGQ